MISVANHKSLNGVIIKGLRGGTKLGTVQYRDLELETRETVDHVQTSNILTGLRNRTLDSIVAENTTYYNNNNVVVGINYLMRGFSTPLPIDDYYDEGAKYLVLRAHNWYRNPANYFAGINSQFLYACGEESDGRPRASETTAAIKQAGLDKLGNNILLGASVTNAELLAADAGSQSTQDTAFDLYACDVAVDINKLHELGIKMMCVCWLAFNKPYKYASADDLQKTLPQTALIDQISGYLIF